MTIAFVGTMGIPARYGGFETFVEEISRRISAKGFRCLVYGVSRGCALNQDPETVITRTVPQIGVPTVDRFLREFWPILEARRFGVDVVHIVGGSLSVLLWRLLGIKTVVTLDGMEWKRASYHELVRVIAKVSYVSSVVFAHSVTVDSDFMRGWASRSLGKTALLVGYGPRDYVPPNDMELTSFLDRFGLKKNGYFLFVGRLIPEKGVHMLVDVFRDHPDKTVAIVGADPFGGEYEQTLRRNATPNVRFLGPLYGRDYELINLGALAQIRPSVDNSEGLPPAAVEAMGFGLPVIASRVPQHVEAFGDSAIYSEVGSSKSLSRGIDLVSSSLRVRQELKASSLTRVRERFSWDQWANILSTVYLDPDL